MSTNFLEKMYANEAQRITADDGVDMVGPRWTVLSDLITGLL